MKPTQIFTFLFSTAWLLSSLSLAGLAQENSSLAEKITSSTERQNQFEYWQFIRTDIPIQNHEGLAAWFIPDKLQALTLARTGSRYQGPGPGIMRYSVGPIWNFGSHVSAGLLGEFVYLNPDGKTNKREYRIVPELSFKGKLDYNLSWLDRNWLEYRIFPDTSSFRYRNMARLNWKLDEKWSPFISDEIFYDFNKGFNQNRARIGIGYTFEPGTRLDIGYMALHRKDSQGWYLDHALTLFLYFSPPASKLIGD